MTAFSLSILAALCLSTNGIVTKSIRENLQQTTLRDAAEDVQQGSPLRTSADLFAAYSEVFKSGNRNAASHLWASYVLDRSPTMTPETLQHLFMSFCPISGSPVTPSPTSEWHYDKVAMVGGATHAGNIHHCCWPCVCDTKTFLKVDTKTVTTAGGPKTYHFLVYGNPCHDPAKIPEQAPDVRCSKEGKLEGATLSDHQHIIGTV